MASKVDAISLINLHARPPRRSRPIALRGHVVTILVVRLLARHGTLGGRDGAQNVVLEPLAVVQRAAYGDDDGDDEQDDGHDGKDGERLARGLVVLGARRAVHAHQLEEEVGEGADVDEN